MGLMGGRVNEDRRIKITQLGEQRLNTINQHILRDLWENFQNPIRSAMLYKKINKNK